MNQVEGPPPSGVAAFPLSGADPAGRTGGLARRAAPPSGPPRLARAGLGLCLLAVAAPLVYYGEVLFPFVAPKAAWFRVATAGVAGLLLHRLLTRHVAVSWREDLTLLGLVGLLVVSAVAAAVGVAPVHSFFGDLERMGGVWALLHVVVFYIGLRTFADEERWPLVLRVAGGVVLALAISGLLDRYGLWIFERPDPRPDGLTGNSGYLAAAMLLGGALVAGLALRSRGWERWGWAAGTALCLTVLFMAQTRAVLLGLGVGSAVGVIAYAGFRGRAARRWVLGLVGLAVVAGGLLLIATRVPALAAALETLPGVSRLAGTDPSAERRLNSWRLAAEAYAARPLLGWGPENEAMAIGSRTDYYRVWIERLRPDRTHNTYLGLLVTMGPLGLAAFLLFLTGLVRAHLRGRRAGRLGDGETALLLGALAGYAVYLFFWFEDLTAWVLIAVIAARAATAASARPLLEFAAPRSERRPVAVLAAMWLTLGVLVVSQALLPLRQAALVGTAEYDPDLTVVQRMERFEAAIEAPATQRFHALLRHERFVQEVLADSAVARDLLLSARALRSAQTGLAAARVELRREPFNYGLYSTVAGYGRLLFRFSGDERHLDEARRVLEDAIRIAPAQLRTRHLLAQVELVAGDTDRAEAILHEALARNDVTGETQHHLALVALVREDLDEALRWIGESATHRHRPSGPELHLALARALGEAGRTGDVARAHDHYMAAVYCTDPPDARQTPDERRSPDAEALGLFCEQSGAGIAARSSLRTQDVEVVARLPLTRLRAGDAEGAIGAALLMGRLLPGLRGEVTEFVLDASAGRVGSWLDREALVDPERARRMLERQREERAEERAGRG